MTETPPEIEAAAARIDEAIEQLNQTPGFLFRRAAIHPDASLDFPFIEVAIIDGKSLYFAAIILLSATTEQYAKILQDTADSWKKWREAMPRNP